MFFALDALSLFFVHSFVSHNSDLAEYYFEVLLGDGIIAECRRFCSSTFYVGMVCVPRDSLPRLLYHRSPAAVLTLEISLEQDVFVPLLSNCLITLDQSLLIRGCPPIRACLSNGSLAT